MSVQVSVTYPFGSMLRLQGKFTDPNRVDLPLDPAPEEGQVAHTLADPTVVTAKLKKPDGTIVTKVYGTDAEIIRDDVGEYHMDVSCDAAGTWTYGWFGTGALQAARENDFKVDATAF